VLTAAAPVVFGDAILENAKLEVDLALLGELGVSSALAFDLGVYLVVLGLVLMVFEAFGGDDRDAVPDAFTPTEPDPGPGRDPDPAPDLAAAPDDALDADAPDDALDSDALEEEVLT
jgi:multicomponent Na+:H+ antiporter subunit B